MFLYHIVEAQGISPKHFMRFIMLFSGPFQVYFVPNPQALTRCYILLPFDVHFPKIFSFARNALLSLTPSQFTCCTSALENCKTSISLGPPLRSTCTHVIIIRSLGSYLVLDSYQILSVFRSSQPIHPHLLFFLIILPLKIRKIISSSLLALTPNLLSSLSLIVFNKYSYSGFPVLYIISDLIIVKTRDLFSLTILFSCSSKPMQPTPNTC